MKMEKLLKEHLDEKIKKQHRYLGNKSVHIIFGKKDKKPAVHIFTKDDHTITDEKLKFVKDEAEYDTIRKALFKAFTQKKK